MNEEEIKALMAKVQKEVQGIISKGDADAEAKATAIQKKYDDLAKELSDLKDADKTSDIIKEVTALAAEVKALKEAGEKREATKGLRAYIEENSEVLKNLKTRSRRLPRFSLVRQ